MLNTVNKNDPTQYTEVNKKYVDHCSEILQCVDKLKDNKNLRDKFIGYSDLYVSGTDKNRDTEHSITICNSLIGISKQNEKINNKSRFERVAQLLFDDYGFIGRKKIEFKNYNRGNRCSLNESTPATNAQTATGVEAIGK